MTTQDHLIRMANQIALNLATMGEQAAAEATADHIASFWDPRMKAAILADGAGLSHIAVAAITILRGDPHPPHMTGATKFGTVDGGERSDAG